MSWVIRRMATADIDADCSRSKKKLLKRLIGIDWNMSAAWDLLTPEASCGRRL